MTWSLKNAQNYWGAEMKRKIERVIVFVLVCAVFGMAVKISAQCCHPAKEVQKPDGNTAKAQEIQKAEDKTETASVRLPKNARTGLGQMQDLQGDRKAHKGNCGEFLQAWDSKSVYAFRHLSPDALLFPASSIRLPVSSSQFQITNFELPITSSQYPISSFQYPISNY